MHRLHTHTHTHTHTHKKACSFVFAYVYQYIYTRHRAATLQSSQPYSKTEHAAMTCKQCAEEVDRTATPTTLTHLSHVHVHSLIHSIHHCWTNITHSDTDTQT
jgi:hypothetical protein